MTRGLTIALDGMGGDHGPETVIGGADIASVRHPDIRFLIYGDETKIRPFLEKHPRVLSVSEIIHTDVSVSMEDKPSQALRRGRKTSSMWLAIDAVKAGEAQAAVSAGNTGALMAMAKVILRMMPNVERPALAALWPTARGESVMLDLGATVGADGYQLVQFAAMGEAFARVVFNIEQPTVGLLNIGEEEVKGTEGVKLAAQMLREADLPIRFHGFVEGDDIAKGTVDVVVTDGYTGNIALKTAEGMVRLVVDYLRAAMRSSLLSRLGYLLAYGAFRALAKKLDPRASNGAVFLGLNGLVVKSHGGTDAIGFAAAIDVAVDVASADLLSKIVTDLDRLSGLTTSMAGRKQNSDIAESEAVLS
ncbi:fatty acid/phospholipid synthesis protein PlsX [Parvibaculum lavamentivorans DS-1]|uniref:Phosphate acyltransferase n=1 Tax=Parvibaculum lavamentivorans (strain DS-1 / DSM 13023 / NCIMB 13966) TaxID=402881 RepID=PLSX_PARL1|nr:phosphate acyltransferase PlsX [Parvibaculum lavamentivorans]A7HX96.1 RecName: Full=Phosphate acyltransferase; AltName: Full=Acyl-ACP phosphotransacylase; AltName: Full=Acyl-[acyl-carrier-protein]--phosphate acyltransferase; AltName: Full=Phosphate-acyl-ACP acyltransferase [Parvibaculum lavamentivorans DS-1]ABS64529.1 fatty acid/phospholipid synthesis protein PlsX [Parvibaculum lavamentivorans DS-1]